MHPAEPGGKSACAESGEKGAGGPECRSGISASGTAIRADTEGDSGQGDAGSFICDRNPGVRAYRDQMEDINMNIGFLVCRDGERSGRSHLDVRRKQRWRSIWNMRETSCCVERIGLFLCQLYGRRDEPAGILEDYQILRRKPGLRKISRRTRCAIPLRRT